MKELAERLAADPNFLAALPSPGRRATMGSAVGAADSLAIAAAARARRGVVLAVVADPDDADRLVCDFEHFGVEAIELPARGSQPERLRMRLDAAEAARAAGTRVLVAPVVALLEPLPNETAVRDSVLDLKVGIPARLPELTRRLVERGYERVPLVAKQGELSLRGDLLDFWPWAAETPLRVETLGDRVDSIRRFDVGTQRSIERADRVAIPLLRDGEMAEMDPIDAFGDGCLGALVEATRVEERAQALSLQSDSIAARAHRLFNAMERRGRLELRTIPGGDHDLGARSVREMGVGLRPSHDVLTAAAKQGPVVVFCGNAGEAKRLREILADRGVDPALPIEVRIGELSRGFTLPKVGFTALTHPELIGAIALRRPARTRKTHESRAVETVTELRPGDHVVHAIHGVGLFHRVERLQKGTGEEEHLVLEFADETKLYVPASRIDLVGKYIGAGRAAPPLDKIGGVSFARRKAQVERAVADMAAELLETHALREMRTGFACPSDDELQREFEAAFPFVDTEDQVKVTVELKRDLETPRPMDRLLCGDVGYGKTELAMRAAYKMVRAGKQVAVLVPTTVLAEQHLRSFRERFAEFPVQVDALSRFRNAKETREVLRRAAEGTVDVLIGTHRMLSNDVRLRDLGLVIVDEEQRFGVRAKERLKKLRAAVDVLSMSATPIPRTLHQALVGLRDISSLTTPPPGREAVETHISEREDDELLRRTIRDEVNRGGQVYFVHNRIASLDARARHLAHLVPEARYGVAHGQMGDDDLEEAMTAFVTGEFDVLVSTAIVESGLDIERANTILIDHAEWFGLADLHQLRGRVGRGAQKAYCHLLIPRAGSLNADAKARIRAVEELQQLGSGFDLAMRDLEIRGAGNLLGSQQSGHIAAVGYELYCRLLKMTVDRCLRDRREKMEREARAAARLGIARPEPLAREAVTALSDEGAAPLEAERPAVLAQMEPELARGDDERGIPAPKVGDGGFGETEGGADLEVGVRAFLPESYIPNVRMRLEAYRLLDGVRDRASREAVEADLRDRFGRLPEEARRLVEVFLVKNRLRGSGVKQILYSRDRYVVDSTDRAKTDAAFAAGFRDRRWVDDGRLHLVFDRGELPPDVAFGKLVKAIVR